MQMCKWHWECCEALLGNMMPLGRLSGQSQLSVSTCQDARQRFSWHMHAPYLSHLSYALACLRFCPPRGCRRRVI